MKNKISPVQPFPPPPLSTQFLETYSSTFDAYFETHPIEWDSKEEKFTINSVSHCKLYWFNTVIIFFGMTCVPTGYLIRRQFLYGANSTWTGIFFPILGFLFMSVFIFVLIVAYYASGVVALLTNLIQLEELILKGKKYSKFSCAKYS